MERRAAKTRPDIAAGTGVEDGLGPAGGVMDSGGLLSDDACGQPEDRNSSGSGILPAIEDGRR
jgi:hypothetical protein